MATKSEPKPTKWSGLEFLDDQAFTLFLNAYFEDDAPHMEAVLTSSSTGGNVNRDIEVLDFDNETMATIQSDANQLVTLANRLAFLMNFSDDGIRISADVMSVLSARS